MTADSSILRTQEYKGCGIRAASYKVGPRDSGSGSLLLGAQQARLDPNVGQ